MTAPFDPKYMRTENGETFRNRMADFPIIEMRVMRGVFVQVSKRHLLKTLRDNGPHLLVDYWNVADIIKVDQIYSTDPKKR